MVLFDEVEKAHRMFNILLQVLDDGRLTDSQGRVVDFKNTVIIMTSNLGSDKIQEMAGASYEEIKAAVMNAVNQHFRPEFVNRIDEIRCSIHLGKSKWQVLQIFNCHAYANVFKSVTWILYCQMKPLTRKLIAVGYDPVWHARPLKRTIQQESKSTISQIAIG
ncbi:MAG: AAA family ATPase [Moraxella sp.]